MALDPARTVAELEGAARAHRRRERRAAGRLDRHVGDARGLAARARSPGRARARRSTKPGTSGSRSPAPRERALLLGGHIDSVPNGGWLDGCLNVMAGVEVLRRIAAEGTPPLTVRLVNWAAGENGSAPPQAPAPAYTPAPAPAPPPGLVDNFATDAGLNPSVWMTQTPLLQSSGPVERLRRHAADAFLWPGGNADVGRQRPEPIYRHPVRGPVFAALYHDRDGVRHGGGGIPFEVYLVSPDLRQWLSVAGHLGGAGGPREGIGIRTPFGGARIPLGGGPSPEHGIWANWTGSAQPISALGSKIYPAPIPGLAYTITMTVGADGIASVSLQDPAGLSLGALNAMPVGTGPFHMVLASRREGPTFASWRAVQLTSLAPQPVADDSASRNADAGLFPGAFGSLRPMD